MTGVGDVLARGPLPVTRAPGGAIATGSGAVPVELKMDVGRSGPLGDLGDFGGAALPVFLATFFGLPDMDGGDFAGTFGCVAASAFAARTFVVVPGNSSGCTGSWHFACHIAMVAGTSPMGGAAAAAGAAGFRAGDAADGAASTVDVRLARASSSSVRGFGGGSAIVGSFLLSVEGLGMSASPLGADESSTSMGAAWSIEPDGRELLAGQSPTWFGVPTGSVSTAKATLPRL